MIPLPPPEHILLGILLGSVWPVWVVITTLTLAPHLRPSLIRRRDPNALAALTILASVIPGLGFFLFLRANHYPLPAFGLGALSGTAFYMAGIAIIVMRFFIRKKRPARGRHRIAALAVLALVVASVAGSIPNTYDAVVIAPRLFATAESRDSTAEDLRNAFTGRFRKRERSAEINLARFLWDAYVQSRAYDLPRRIAENPACPPELLRELRSLDDPYLNFAIVQHPNTPHDVLMELHRTFDFHTVHDYEHIRHADLSPDDLRKL